MNANLPKRVQPSAKNAMNCDMGAEVRFFAGEWSEIDKILPHVHGIGDGPNSSSGCHPASGYDIILMAETVYSISVFQNLYELLKKVILHWVNDIILLSFTCQTYNGVWIYSVQALHMD